MRMDLTAWGKVRRGLLAHVVLLAVVAVALPRELVWCTTPAGHGSLENLLLGHCSATRTMHSHGAAATSSSERPHPAAPQGCHTQCTDIPVSHPADMDASGGPAVAECPLSGKSRSPDPERDIHVSAVPSDPPVGQVSSCLAATVLLR